MNKKYLVIALFFGLLVILYTYQQSQTRVSADELLPKDKPEEKKEACNYFSFDNDHIIPVSTPTNPINNVTELSFPCVIVKNATADQKAYLTSKGISFQAFGGVGAETSFLIIPGIVIDPGKGGQGVIIDGKTIEESKVKIDFNVNIDFTIPLGTGNTQQIKVSPIYPDGIIGKPIPCNPNIIKKGALCTIKTTGVNPDLFCKPKECTKSTINNACIKDYYKSSIDITQFPNKLSDKIPGITVSKVGGVDGVYEIVICGVIKNGELVVGGDVSSYFNSGVITNDPDDSITYGYYGGAVVEDNPKVTKIKVSQDACPKIPIDKEMGFLPNNMIPLPPPAPIF